MKHSGACALRPATRPDFSFVEEAVLCILIWFLVFGERVLLYHCRMNGACIAWGGKGVTTSTKLFFSSFSSFSFSYRLTFVFGQCQSGGDGLLFGRFVWGWMAGRLDGWVGLHKTTDAHTQKRMHSQKRARRREGVASLSVAAEPVSLDFLLISLFPCSLGGPTA